MLEEVIKDLTEATDELRKEIEKLTAALSAQAAAPTPKPTKVQTPDTDGPATEDLKSLALKMAREGHKLVMRARLDAYPAKKLEDLTAEQAIDFMAWLQTLGEK